MSTARHVLDEVASAIEPELEIADPARAKREVLRVLQFASATDGYVSGSHLAKMLDTSRQSVQQRAARGGLLVRADEMGVLYPLWQFRPDGRVVSGLTKVIETAHRKGWSDARLIAWFEDDHGRIEELRGGKGAQLVAELKEIRAPLRRRDRRDRDARSIRDE